MCTGTMAMVNEGEYIKAEGDYVEHGTYGRQFRIASFSIEAPEDLFSIERYLGSGAIRASDHRWQVGLLKNLKRTAFGLLKVSRSVLQKLRESANGKPRKFISSFMISRICVRP